ncbi:hypothetical protein BT69DRAFT_1348023 [Atractiella rhizophila]|nr:hypothetical protein BT69DRAFT_1348023 [Atractiella rhizophila]
MEETDAKTENNAERSASRPIRSRAACSQCRQVKQKCDGPSRIPCRRCELYSLECTYDGPPSAQRSASNRTVRNIIPASGNNEFVTQKLLEISDRLQRIEFVLQQPTTANKASPKSPNASASPQSVEDFNQDRKNARTAFEEGAEFSADNPIYTFAKTIENLEAMSLSSTSQPSYFPATRASSDPLISRSDAISKGVVTFQEANEMWDIFWTRCLPWVPTLSFTRERDINVMRNKSPLLFHVILTTGAYYKVLEGPRGVSNYRALAKVLYEDLGHTMMSSTKTSVSVNFVHSLLFATLWKVIAPTDHHSSLPGSAQLSAKLNDDTSFMLGGMASRISHRLRLQTSILSLSTVSQVADPENFHEVLSAVRAYFLLLCTDTQAALQSGRPAGILDPTEALKSLRLFASIRDQPSDVRLAGMVELWNVARSAPFYPVGEQDEAKEVKALDLCHLDLERWRQYWPKTLRETNSYASDPLASTLENIFEPWLRFRVNSSSLRWWNNYIAAINNGEEVKPPEAFFVFMTLAVEAGEELIFKLSMESRAPESPVTAVRFKRWPQPMEPHIYPPLTPDVELAKMISAAPDTLLMTIFAYPPLLLGKLAGDGILTLDATVRHESSQLVHRQPSSSKICRLLELSAAFLDICAPHPEHPCRKQAQVIRHIQQAIANVSTGRGSISPPVAPSFSGMTPASSTTSTSSFTAPGMFSQCAEPPPSTNVASALGPVLMQGSNLDLNQLMDIDWNSLLGLAQGIPGNHNLQRQ